LLLFKLHGLHGCCFSFCLAPLSVYPFGVRENHEMLSLAELQDRLRPFCERHRIRRLEIFGSAARGHTRPGSDVDLLVTLDDSAPVSVAELLEMAGEAEEIVGAPVDFVLLPHLKNRQTALHETTFCPARFACMDVEQLGRLNDS
jgi:uncharacterized protein